MPPTRQFGRSAAFPERISTGTRPRSERPSRHTPSAVVVAGLMMLGLAAISWSSQMPLARPLHADRIVVQKGAHSLTLFSGGTPVKTYRVALGFNPAGPKTQAGDGRTPEGLYVIDYRNSRSRYHLSLHLSYPSPADVAKAARLGVPPGGDIVIHGTGAAFGWGGRFHWMSDWTDGCIAVTNAEIEEIWDAVPDGTPVELRR